MPVAARAAAAFGAALALLAALLAGWAARRARPARPGVEITPRDYAVDVAWLRAAAAADDDDGGAGHWGGGGDDQDDVVARRLAAASGRLAATFVPSARDAALDAFLDASAAATATRWGQAATLLKSKAFWALQRYLGWSRPDASGFLRKATLHVASEAQLRDLVAAGGAGGGGHAGTRGRSAATRGHADGGPEHAAADAGAPALTTLLDVGSGTGTVTDKLRRALGIADPGAVTCVENAGALRRLLQARGFRAVGTLDETTTTAAAAAAAAGGGGRGLFSHASLLNVLDRADDPAALLSATLDRVADGGLLVVAIVLPFKAKVHVGRVGTRWGTVSSRRPRAPLPLARRTGAAAAAPFEAGATLFLEALQRLHPGRLSLVRWTRLPYVSSGDVVRTHYSIRMAAMTFRVGGRDGDG